MDEMELYPEVVATLTRVRTERDAARAEVEVLLQGMGVLQTALDAVRGSQEPYLCVDCLQTFPSPKAMRGHWRECPGEEGVAIRNEMEGLRRWHRDIILGFIHLSTIGGIVMANVTVNGVEYAPVAEPTGDLKIVILQRGWVMVGRLERTGNDCKLNGASVIRKWGTTRGLGEIATGGPTSKTVLDPCGGLVEFDWLTVVACIGCQESPWAASL